MKPRSKKELKKEKDIYLKIETLLDNANTEKELT